jgi:hypothetical protein
MYFLNNQLDKQGDYSAMMIDPSDDCTFWYCTQYQDSTEQRGWKTKIAAFNLGGCDAAPETAQEEEEEEDARDNVRPRQHWRKAGQ